MVKRLLGIVTDEFVCSIGATEHFNVERQLHVFQHGDNPEHCLTITVEEYANLTVTGLSDKLAAWIREIHMRPIEW